MKFYKLCWHHAGRLLSSNYNTACGIEYYKDRIAYAPNGTGLFVFNDKRAAMDYDSHISYLKLFECVAANPVHTPYVPEPSYALDYWDCIEQFGNYTIKDGEMLFNHNVRISTFERKDSVYTVSMLKFVNEIDRKTGEIIESYLY